MTFWEHLQNLGIKYGALAAFEEADGRQRTYEAFVRDLGQMRSYLLTVPEQRIAILGRPSYEWLLQVYGGVCAGKTMILGDGALPLQEIAGLLTFADTQLLLQEVPDRELTQRLPGVKCITYLDQWRNAAANAAAHSAEQPEEGEFLLFSSGTSGNAKAAVHGPDTYYDNAEKVAAIYGGSVGDRVLIPLPMHHIFALCMTMLFLIGGRRLSFGTVGSLRRDLKWSRPTELLAVVSVAEHLLEHGECPESLKRITLAGSVCSRELEQKAETFGCSICNVYGATELGGIAINLPGDPVDHLTPAPGTRIRIDPDGTLWIRTPDHIREYYKQPEATARFLTEEITLGDVGQYREDGTFYILGRREGIIAMDNGDKLFVTEMEQALDALYNVRESCVFYRDHKVCATVAVAEGTSPEQIRPALEEYNRIQPKYRKIEEFLLTDRPLPRTNIGKLSRAKIEEWYLQQKEETDAGKIS